MDITWEAHLLKLYMQDYIDSRKPVTLEFQLNIWKEYGFIHEGYTDSNFMSFETWKKIKQDLGCIMTWMDLELKGKDLKFIERGRMSFDDIFKQGRIPMHHHNPIFVDPICHI